MKQKDAGIILALDVDSKEKANLIINETENYIDAVKIGYPLILSTSLGILSDLKRSGKPLIADLKVADVPHVSAEICRLATKAGADYVIVQGFMGRDVLEACSKAAQIFVVSDMSHPGALEFMSTHNTEIANLARDYAVGIVAPATRPQTIKSLRKIVGNLVVISPGIKAQGAEIGSAIEAGADFEIVGRAIYNSGNPKKESEAIYKQLKKRN